jgi:hypothetical protein
MQQIMLEYLQEKEAGSPTSRVDEIDIAHNMV